MKKTVTMATALLCSLIAANSSAAASPSTAALQSSIVTTASMTAPGTIDLNRLPSTTDLVSPFLPSTSLDGFDAALTFVKKTGLNKNLSLLLLETMKRDGLVVSAIKSKGLKTVQAIVVNAIILERAHHENEWENVLANTYSKFFRASELESLTVLKEKSPYFARLISMQNEITAQVNNEGSSLLETAQRNVKARVAADLGA